MAGKNVQYNLQIHADSTQAKRQLEDLSITLSKISNMHIKTTVEDSAIEKASEAAKELQKHLQGATNVDTGKLNLTTFNKSLTNANTSVSELSRSLLEAGTLGQQAFTQLTAAIANTEVPIRQVNKTLQNWGTTLKNTAKWEISSTAIHGLESALSGAVGYARDLNKSLTDIRIVTGQSVEDMSRFAAQANRAAKELSTSTKAYADASLIYYQQGDSDEVVAQKAAITLKAANASFKTSAAEMSEYLTAVWNSYQVGADELERYVDIMAALGAKTATSLEEIATSMQKVAATGNTVGVSMEQVSSIIATVSSVTRESAESIGTSYKTIFARIGDLKLGKTDEEGVGLGQVSSQLETIGVDILDASGNLRDMGDIITDLGNKWQTMTEAQKTATAQVVAGKRQYTQLMALFENWDMYQSNIDIAENSEGALQNMQDIYAESWESASKRVQAALEGIYGSLLNDQAFIKVLNFIEKIVESVGGMVKGLGGVEGIIFNIGGLMSNLFSADIAQGMTKAFTTISGLFKRAGTEQQQYLANSKMIRAELEATVQDSTLINQSSQYENTGIIEVMKAKERMVESSKNLTAEQQSHIEGVIAAYQKEVAAIVEVQKAQDKAKMDADIQEESLKSKVMQDEVRSVAKRKLNISDYDLLDRQGRETAYKMAQESLISDALNLDLEVDVKLDDGQVKKEMSTVQTELNKVFGTTKGLTFDKLISESKTLTTQLGQTKNVLAQLKAMTGENGIDLFAANKSTEEIMSDLQHMVNAYKEITGEDLQFEITGLDGTKQQIVDLGAATNLTKEQMQEVATQMVQHFSNLENTTAQKVTAIKNALLRIVPPELQGEFQKLFTKWEEMAILGESSSHRVEKAMKDALKRMNQEMEQTFSKFSKGLENMVKIGSSLSSIWGIINTISGTIDTLKDPETTGWEKFGAVLSVVSSVLMSVKTVSDGAAAVMSIINSLVAIGTGLEVANTKAKQANTEATKDKTKAQLEGVAAQVAENAENVTDTITKGANKWQLAGMGFVNVLKTKVGPALLNLAKIAWPVALIAGIAAITAAAIKAAKTIEENFQKSILKTKEALDKNEQATADLMNNTAKLDQIMKDNTLTYEEKIAKINEITKAYGFQAEAIDILTGSYGSLQDKMLTTLRSDLKGQIQEAQALTAEGQQQADRSSYQAPAGGLAFQYSTGSERFGSYDDYSQKFDIALKELEEIYLNNENLTETEAQDFINNELLSRFGSSVKITDKDQWAQGLNYNGQSASNFDLEEYTYDTIIAAFGAEKETIGGLFSEFNGTTSGTARASLLADEAWTNRHSNWTNDGAINGILDMQNLGTYDTDFSTEGKMWIEYADQLAQFGLQFDEVNAQITGIVGQDIDYQGFYNWMQEQEDIMNLVNSGAETYTGQIHSILSNKGFGNVYRGSEITSNTQALLSLVEDPDFYKHILTADPNDKVNAATLHQMYKSHSFTTDNAQYANEMLSGYGAYGEATQILDYIYSVAEESATESVSATDIVDTILNTWNGKNGKQELTLDIALRLKPSDIEITEDGIPRIKPEVEKYINSQATLASNQNKTQTWQKNQTLLTQGSYDANSIAQMRTLWNTEGYDTSVGYTADEFMLLSEGTRNALFENINTKNLKAEQDAYDTNLKILQQRQTDTADALTAYVEADNKVQELLGDNEELISAVINHSNGATNWGAIKDYKAFVDTEIENLQEQLDAYEAIDQDSSLTDDQKKAKKAEIFADEAALQAAKDRKAALVLEQETLNNAMQEGIAIEQAAAIATSDYNTAVQRQQTVNLENIQQERQKTEKAASLWSQAITDMKNLSSDQLSELFILDEEAKNKYGTDEWIQYAYDSAMSYYTDLERLYAGDAAKLAEIAQQKQETNRAYYAEMSAISQAAYNRERTQLQQTLEDRKEATAAMSETLQEGNLSSQQRLALGDKASAWESATEKERLSMYGAALGQEALAQIDINTQARGLNKDTILNRITKPVFHQGRESGLSVKSAELEAKQAAKEWQQAFTKAMTSTDEGALEAFFGENMDVFDEATRQIFLNINKQTKGASLSASEIWDLYLAELNKVDDANDQVWASFEDNAVKAIMATIEAEEQAAQEIVDIWKQAIKDIHTARMGLADGQSVAQTFANDDEGLARVIGQMAADGQSWEAIQQAITDQNYSEELFNMEHLTLEQFSDSRGVLSAINNEGTGLIEGASFEEGAQAWADIVTARIQAKGDELLSDLDETTKAAYEAWSAENNGSLSDFLLSYYGLDDPNNTARRDALYQQEFGIGGAYISRYGDGTDDNRGTQYYQDAFDEATTRYNNTISDSQQDADDWYAIMQGIDQVRAGKAVDLYSALGNDADGIMNRLHYETKGDLNAIDYEEAQSKFETANADITAAQVTLVGDLTTAGILNQDGTVADGANFMESNVNEMIDQATINSTAAHYEPRQVDQEHMQAELDLADTRQSAISGILDASTMEEMATAATNLREAYAGADEETQQWVEDLIDAREAGEDGLSANKKLTSQHVRGAKDLARMTKAQREQYKAMLKANNVTVDGYENLEEYFEVVDAAGRAVDEMQGHLDDFSMDQYSDSLADGVASTEDTAQMVENILPESMRSATDEIMEISNTVANGGTIFDALSGWLQDDGTFTQSINDVLNTMGLGADQIAAMQSSVQAQVEANGSIGAVDWLQVFADANVDPTQFDSIIEALNSAMAQIQALLDANGITLDPPWTPIPTLGSMGVGRGKGGSGGGSKDNKGGGGGGGSKNKEKKEYKRAQDEIERYHVQNETLDRVGEKLDMIDKLKDRAYGQEHIAQLEAETAALREQYAAQEDLYNEAMKWQAADRSELIALNVGVKFNDDGTIINYEDVVKRLMDQYNAEVDRYNNSEQDEGDKIRLENAEQYYDDAIKAIENYEEAIKTANDAQLEMEEILNNISEIELEKITYNLELNLDINEKDLEMLEYFKDKYEDVLHAQDNVFNSLVQTAAQYEQNLSAIDKSYQDLVTQHELGVITDQDYQEGISQLSDELINNLNDLNEIKDELAETYSNTLELAREEIDKTSEALEHFNEVMESYITIANLSGKDFFAIDGEEVENSYKKLQHFYDAQYMNNIARINVHSQHLEVLLEEEEYFKNQILLGVELSDLEKQEYDKLKEEIQETREQVLSSTEEALDTLYAGYENTINGITEDLDEFMSGAAASISHLADQYAYFQEEQGRYVSTAKELYEVSKLNRQIEGTLAEVSSDASKEALKALQEKINKQSELNELTEYDIEMNQLQYQLLLARIQLEEAQNAKDVVRLTRDENGNYAYRYSADQDRVSEAMQNYEDVLQQINDLTTQRTSEIEQQMIDAMQTYTQKFQEIALDQTLTAEERNMKLTELNTQFADTMAYIQGQYNIVTENLTNNQEAIAKTYGVNLSDILASTAGNVNSNIQNMIDKSQEMVKAMSEAIFGDEGANAAWDELALRMQNINGIAGTTYNGMIANTNEMGAMNAYAAQEALDTLTVLEQTLDPLNSLTSAWDVHNESLEKTIENYEKLALRMTEAQGTLAGVDAIAGVNNISEEVKEEQEQINTIRELTSAYFAKYGGAESYEEGLQEIIDNQEMTNEEKKAELDGYLEVFDIVLSNIDLLTRNALSYSAINAAGTTGMNTITENNIEQQIVINAEFPNATDYNEIMEAFMNLADYAQQFASQKN